MKDLTQVQQDELLEWLANARTTQAMALGHTKSAMNAQLVYQYEKELERRNLQIPNNEELYEKGKFNGVGST
jgi:hypothetical protein